MPDFHNNKLGRRDLTKAPVLFFEDGTNPTCESSMILVRQMVLNN
jgi:hypothetical protein